MFITCSDIWKKVLFEWANSETYFELSEVSKMELFMKIINN